MVADADGFSAEFLISFQS